MRTLLIAVLAFFSFTLSANPVVGLRKESMRLFPEDKAQIIGQMGAGDTAVILQESGDWSLIEISRGAQSLKGWVRTATLGLPLQRPELEASPWNTRNDKNQYRVSVAVNPVTLFFPWVELQVGIAMTPHLRFNLTPTLMTWAYGSKPFNGALYGGTVSLTGFFDRWQGWYLEPGFVFMKPSSGGGHWLGGQLIGGYEHVWTTGLFMNFGLGAGVGHFEDGSDSEDDWFDFDGTYPYPTWNILVGYRF